MFKAPIPAGSPIGLTGLLRQTLAQHPDVPAAIDASPDAVHVVTRQALWDHSCALASELATYGVGRGDCVAVWLPNWSDALAWQFAATMLSAHVIGVSTRYNIDEVAHVLQTARPKVLTVAHAFVGLDLDVRLRSAVKLTTVEPPRIAVVSGPFGVPPNAVEVASYDVGQGAWAPGKSAVDPTKSLVTVDDSTNPLAVAFTTSGSTGKPKLAAHASHAVAVHAQACAQAGDWRVGDVTLCALPLSGVFAYIPAITTLASGGTCLLEPVFDAAKIIADMDRFGVTHVIAADDVVGRLAEAWRATPVKLGRWRRLLLADFNGRSQELV